MSTNKIKVGVVGGAGYTGGELLRLLLLHPQVTLVFAHSNSHANQPIYRVHTDLFGDTDLLFTDQVTEAIDVVFLCLGHGDSKVFLQENTFESHVKIIDLSQAFTHQHLEEIGESLTQLQPHTAPAIKFIPERGDFTRGIFASVVLESSLAVDDLQMLYTSYYATHPFTHFSTEGIHLKQVINTNKCLISIEKHQNDVLITSAIDNLLKGASGQAVQNMNLLFGLDEKTGLTLKASAF